MTPRHRSDLSECIRNIIVSDRGLVGGELIPLERSQPCFVRFFHQPLPLFPIVGDLLAFEFHNLGRWRTDTLGLAFEPEQRFESPDGSAITFDIDYFGNHRGVTAMPGPFAAAPGRQAL